MAGDVQLGEVAEIIMGQSPPGETYNEHGAGLPFFQGVADFNYRHPTPRVFCTAPSRIAAPGDILLSVRAPIGRVNIADRRCAIGRGLSIIRPKMPEDGRYLEFALRMLETAWQAIEGGGSVFGNATRRDLETLRVPWPEPECARRAIAHILGTLDDKIELNRRMNETLEAMARALFKSWFIDFEPVRRNAARARNQPSPLTPLPGGEGGTTRYRGGFDFSGLIETARELRRKQTPAEAMLWEVLRNRRFMGLKFRRQHQLGDYVVDFYCHELRLVLELDGDIHASKRDKDHKRDAWLKARGYKVLRFPNEQLWDDPDTVLRTLADVVKSTEPNLPSPSGRRVGDEGSVEELDRLFPARLVDSELGPIPEGWKVGTLGAVAENPRRSVRPDSISPDTPYIALEHMPRRHIALSDWGTAEAIESNKFEFRNGEILFGKLRPYFHKVGVAPVDGVCSTDIVVVCPRTPHWFAFVLGVVSSDDFVEFTNVGSTGTRMPRTGWTEMARYEIALPPENLAQAFTDEVRPQIDRIIAAIHQSRTLAALRDALLPKLISGEIRVKDAERFLKERGL